MSEKDFLTEELSKLGFRICRKISKDDICFVFLKQYRVITNNNILPLKFLDKKLIVNIKENTEVEYFYCYSDIYLIDDSGSIYYRNAKNDVKYTADRIINGRLNKTTVTNLLDAIKEDIKNLNVVRLEEFSWQ